MPRAKKDNMYNGPFATRLRHLIDKKGVSQAELARTLDMSRQALNAYTLGETSPDAVRLVSISKYFGVSIDYLLGEQECTKPDMEEIHKITGLDEKSIEFLYSVKNRENQWSKVTGYDRYSAIRAVNMLLSSCQSGGFLGKLDETIRSGTKLKSDWRLDDQKYLETTLIIHSKQTQLEELTGESVYISIGEDTINVLRNEVHRELDNLIDTLVEMRKGEISANSIKENSLNARGGDGNNGEHPQE